MLLSPYEISSYNRPYRWHIDIYKIVDDKRSQNRYDIQSFSHELILKKYVLICASEVMIETKSDYRDNKDHNESKRKSQS